MSHKSITKKYRRAFKQKVVPEYAAGDSINALRTRYGIGGGSTIQKWVKQYRREGLRHKLMVIQSPEEQHQVPVLQRWGGQLEQLVAQLSLDKLILEASLVKAAAQLGGAVKRNGARKSLNALASQQAVK